MIRFASNCGAVLALLCALVACGHTSAYTPDLCRADLLTVEAIEGSSFESMGLLPQNAVDGDPRTRWATWNHHFQTDHYVIVDLGELRYVDYITLDWEKAFSREHQVWIGDENRSWSHFVNVTRTSAGKEHIVLQKQLRYIEIYSTESDPNYGISLWEFQVFGHHNPDCNPDSWVCGNDIINAVGAEASSQENSNKGAEKAIDGDYSKTRWSSAFQDGESITIDLGQTTLIDSVSIYWERAYATDYKLETGWGSGSPWTLLKNESSTGGVDIHRSLNVVASEVKLTSLHRATGYGTSLYEIEVRGTQDPSCIVGCEILYLGLSDDQLWSTAFTSSGRLGAYCHVEEADGTGACDYYAKGRPRSNGDVGVPMNPDLTGTGCVLGGRNTICYANDLAYLTQEERDGMCTTGDDNHIRNGAAQIRWAIKNGWCMSEGQRFGCD